jgi:hypothetical protein
LERMSWTLFNGIDECCDVRGLIPKFMLDLKNLESLREMYRLIHRKPAKKNQTENTKFRQGCLMLSVTVLKLKILCGGLCAH